MTNKLNHIKKIFIDRINCMSLFNFRIQFNVLFRDSNKTNEATIQIKSGI